MLAVHGTTGTLQGTTAGFSLTGLGYSGEHFDAKVQQQYLRARFYDPANGRFNRLDPFVGNMEDPQSLHKYAYVHGDPIGMMDPTGMFGLGGTIAAIGIALGNVAAEVTSGVVILTTLQYAGLPAFNARAAGLLLIANGEFDEGFYIYNVASKVAAQVLGSLESIDSAITLAATGVVLTVAAIKLAKHAPQIADSLLDGARKILDGLDDGAAAASRAVTLERRLEDNAARWLRNVEANPAMATSNAHFYSRHGSQTTLDQQWTRANSGLTPDGFAGNPVDSARFLSHRDQLTAYQSAVEINKRTGLKVVKFDTFVTIGEGFLKQSDTLVRTTNVVAVFDDLGRLKTMYPFLNPLP